MSESTLASWQPRVLSVVRIVVALLFLEHGLVKLVGFPVPGPATLGTVPLAAAIIELVGGVLLAVGLFSRAVAFIVCGEMAVAYFMAHAPRGFYPIANGGEAAILFCFVFLYIVFAGPGPWSLDAARNKA
jgi:putative oxidoreductase